MRVGLGLELVLPIFSLQCHKQSDFDWLDCCDPQLLCESLAYFPPGSTTFRQVSAGWIKNTQDETNWQRVSCRQSSPPGPDDDSLVGHWVRRQTEGQASINGVFWPKCFLGQRACWPPHPAWNNITVSQQPASLSPHDSEWFPEKTPWQRNNLLSAKNEKKKNSGTVFTRSGRHAHNFRGSRAVAVTDTESFRPADLYWPHPTLLPLWPLSRKLITSFLWCLTHDVAMHQ